jgi:hypothetical protein
VLLPSFFRLAKSICPSLRKKKRTPGNLTSSTDLVLPKYERKEREIEIRQKDE